MKEAKLTVITSTFNSGKTLQDTIESILDQDYRPLEYIIVDGASTDNTIELIVNAVKKFEEKQIDFKYISEKDTGIYNAWNKGLELASGDWISFLGSDDEYNRNAIGVYAAEIASNKNLDMVCAKTKMYSDGKMIREFGEAFSWSTFKREMKILHAGSFINQNYFKEYGSFNESFRISGDYEHLLRKGKALKVKFINEYLVKMSADGVSSSLVKNALKESMKARIENGARSPLLAAMDFYWVRLKIFLKQLINGG